MARISEEELGRLKREVSVERLALASGVSLKKRGGDLVGLCPFHDDRGPSLVIHAGKNLWKCFGACQAGGGPIDWVMRRDGVSFRRAVEWLRAETSSSASSFAAGAASPPAADSSGAIPKSSLRASHPIAADTEIDDGELMARVVAHYRDALTQSPEAQAYLSSRGLGDAAMHEAFSLGFANRTLAYRLPAKKLKAGRLLRSRLQEAGVLRPSGHEHLNGSIVVPLFDAEGRVVQMYGRKIGKDLRKGTPLHLYLPGGHRGVFNRNGLAEDGDVILCEALLDALTFWSAGHRNVTSSYGVNGFTAELLQALRDAKVWRVLIAYDRDEAGDKAAAELASKLADAGFGAYRILFPRGMDANRYALKVTPAAQSLGLVVRKAQWLAGARQVSVPADVKAMVTEETVQKATTAARSEVSTSSASVVEPPSSVSSAPAPASSFAARAASAPSAPPSAPVLHLEAREQEVVIRIGDRRWRIRGLERNRSPSQLRVNVMVTRDSSRAGGFFVDTLELYAARQRASFVQQAAGELDMEPRAVAHELGRILMALEAHQEKALRAASDADSAPPPMSDAERAEALSLLRAPDLLSRIAADFEASGMVGERSNLLVAYLAATSRLLQSPLAILVQSSSAAGKSSLMDAVLRFVPPEEAVRYSAMTGQSLFYLGEADVSHKILAIAEEEGARQASYALKLLQSEGELTIASTGKDPATGRLVTQEYRVQGPVMLMLTTTALDVDPELRNRCLVLTVDEGRAQTRAIHALQRQGQTLEGLLARHDSARLMTLHQNAQRLLSPLLVANPYANALTFVDAQTRARRDHAKYLTLISAITLLHQHQRPVKTVQHHRSSLRYIEVTPADIAMANELAQAVLSRSLDDLPPQTRRLLHLVEALVTDRAEQEGVVRSDVRLSRRDIREALGWGHTQLKVHLKRLAEHEYLLVHRKGQRFVYELAFAADGGQRAVPIGLTVPMVASETSLSGGESEDRGQYDSQRSGSEADRSGSAAKRSGRGRPVVGGWSGSPSASAGDESAQHDEAIADGGAKVVGMDAEARSRSVSKRSYVPADVVDAGGVANVTAASA